MGLRNLISERRASALAAGLDQTKSPEEERGGWRDKIFLNNI